MSVAAWCWPPGDRDAWARPSSYSPSVARRCSTSPWPRPGGGARPGGGGARRGRGAGAGAGRPDRHRAGAQPGLRRRLCHLDPVGTGARARRRGGGRAAARRPAGCHRRHDPRAASPAPVATPSASVPTTTDPVTRCGSIAACSRPFAACTATRPCGSWSTPARAWSGSRCRARCPGRRHLGRLPGAAGVGRMNRRPGVARRRTPRASTSTTTSPTTASRRPSSCRCGWGCRCCSRESRASARPRPRGCWPRCSAHRWSGCSATRG